MRMTFGYYLVKQLSLDGYNVTVLDLETDSLSSLCKENDSLFPIICDVRDLKQMKNCVGKSVDKFGSIDFAMRCIWLKDGGAD